MWKPGEPSKVIPVACKGSHGNSVQAYGQLATASAHVEAVHIGEWNETPALVFATTLPKKDNITVYLLQSPGDGTLRGQADGGLDQPVNDRNIFPGIQVPTEPGEKPDKVSGHHVQPDDYGWFARVLAHADAAGLMAFTGGGEPTARYLTKRQGKSHFESFTHSGAGIVQDISHTIHGTRFVGTDHVFRLNGTRMEAFSGVAEDLFQHLVEGRVEQYRHETHALRTSWPGMPRDAKWSTVSIQPDGSVMAMRRLRLR